MSYGDPATGAMAPKPRCWGTGFDSESQECKACSFQNSCRDQVIKANINARAQQAVQMQAPNPMSTASYYSQFAAQPYAAPQPVAPQPAPVPPQVVQQPAQMVRFYQPPAPVYQQPMYQQPQTGSSFFPQPVRPVAQPQVPVGNVGWWPDPLYYQAHTMPVPPRPQLPGETFFQRMMKNAGLAIAEHFLLSMLLSVRQSVWPMRQPQADMVVEIPPQAR